MLLPSGEDSGEVQRGDFGAGSPRGALGAPGAPYLAVDAVGFLAAAAEQSPSLVLDVAHVDVVPVALSKGDPGAPKNQEVVAM